MDELRKGEKGGMALRCITGAIGFFTENRTAMRILKKKRNQRSKKRSFASENLPEQKVREVMESFS